MKLSMTVAMLAAQAALAGVHSFGPDAQVAFRTEPAGFEKLVRTSRTDGRLTIDATEAYAKGAQNLVCSFPTFEDAAFAGDDVVLDARVGSPDLGSCLTYLEMWSLTDRGQRRFNCIKARNPVQIGSREMPARCVAVATCPGASGGYRLRLDLRKPRSGGRYVFHGASVSTAAEMTFARKPAEKAPHELLLHLPFDGTADAAVARGDGKPLTAKGLAFAPGVKGQALRISDKAGSVLEYAFKGNVLPEQGTLSMWVKREATSDARAYLFASKTPFDSRIGTGALYLWNPMPGSYRVDTSDDCDAYVSNAVGEDGDWHHLVFTWNWAGACLWIDGGAEAFDFAGGLGFANAYERARQPYAFSSKGALDAFKSFFIGSWRGQSRFNGLIDEVRVYSDAVGEKGVKELYAMAGRPPKKPVDYAALSAAKGANRHVAAGPDELVLVEEVKLDRAGVAALKARGGRFDAVGPLAFKTCDGTEFLELGADEFDRLALKFDLDPAEPHYVFEIDYPDDAMRTMDLIVQNAFNPNYNVKPLQDYTMQVGLLVGGDYPNSGRIRTHRCLYWTGHTNAVFEAMTARKGQNAAVAAVRLYRTKSRKLAAAKIREPEKADGWGRTLGWYFEDPAINFDFSVPNYAASPEEAMEMADRAAATMKRQGLNLLAYPQTWYNGWIGNGYNPRNHAPSFAQAFYERFDREGLGFVPLVNQETRPVPPGSFTYDMIADGTVHDTSLMVWDSGRPGAGIVRCPSLFNICHPETQAYYERMIERMVADGVSHPSFKGVGFHLKHSAMGWLGLLSGGYNDYVVESFEKKTGIRVPVDRTDPLRGKKYAEWLKANALEPWIRHRCDIVSGFWVRMAAKLRAARPDLKLWLNDIADLDPVIDNFTDPLYNRRMARNAGLDRERLSREAPNVILSQTSLPADYRYTHPGWYYTTAADYEHQRVAHTLKDYWDLLYGAPYPAVNIHDRYWESHPGDANRNRDPARRFKAPWFEEVKWRVTTMNAPGPYALEHFAVPLRFTDVLGITKGGFLIGTYGMEEHLVPFAQAFRALPAVVMDTLPGGGAYVRLRQKDFGGKSYFYVVNTGKDSADVTLRLPKGTVDLVSGEALGATAALKLGPYSLRSFAAPAGKPEFDK